MFNYGPNEIPPSLANAKSNFSFSRQLWRALVRAGCFLALAGPPLAAMLTATSSIFPEWSIARLGARTSPFRSWKIDVHRRKTCSKTFGRFQS